MSILTSVSLDDLKLVVIGAAGALLAAAIIVILSRTVPKSCKIAWSKEWERINFSDKNGKENSCTLQTLLIENMSTVTARNIELRISGSIQSLKASRQRRRWLLLETINVLREDLSVESSFEAGHTKILVKDLEGRTNVKLTYVTDSFNTPDSLRADGKMFNSCISLLYFFTPWQALSRSIVAGPFSPLLIGFLTYSLLAVIGKLLGLK